MSRSRKKTPIQGMTRAPSNKLDKRIANRRIRSRVKQAIHAEREIPIIRELSDPWGFAKDGKRYDPHMDMRK